MIDRRELLVGVGGLVGASVAGCTDLLGPSPGLVMAIDVEDAQLGEGEYPLEEITIEADVDISWSELPERPGEIQVGVHTGPDDTEIIDHRETGSWENEGSETFDGLQGDLLDAYDANVFQPGSHTVECTLGVALYRAEDVIIEDQEPFEVHFTVTDAEDEEDDEDEDDDGDPPPNGDDEDDEDDDPEDGEDDEDENADPADVGTATIEEVSFYAEDPAGLADGDYCGETVDGRPVIGHVASADGTVETVTLGTGEFTVSWEDLPETVPIITWRGQIDGAEETFGYETGPFIWDPQNPWPSTHTTTWDGGGECGLYPPERQWFEGGPFAEIDVDEPGETEYVPLDMTLTVTIWPDANIAEDDVDPILEVTRDEAVYLAVTHLDPSLDVDAVIDGDVE